MSLMSPINADKSIMVSSNWVDNREKIYAGVGELITAINLYSEVLRERDEKTLGGCSAFLRGRGKKSIEYTGLSQDVEDVYTVLRDMSDVSAVLFDCMSYFGDIEEYLESNVFEGIFGCYKNLYDLAVQEIKDYESQGNDKEHHNIAGAVAYMYSALQEMNESYGTVTREVGVSEKSLGVPDEFIRLSDKLA